MPIWIAGVFPQGFSRRCKAGHPRRRHESPVSSLRKINGPAADAAGPLFPFAVSFASSLIPAAAPPPMATAAAPPPMTAAAKAAPPPMATAAAPAPVTAGAAPPPMLDSRDGISRGRKIADDRAVDRGG